MSSSLPSWKQFGGVHNMEKSNNISTNSLSANFFTLKNSYIGLFAISGELIVTNDSKLESNVFVGENLDVYNNTRILGNTFIKKNLIVTETTGIGGNVDISGDTLMWGNLHIMQNYEIEKNLEVNGNLIHMGLLVRNPQGHETNEYNINIKSVDKKLGLNNANPLYSLDICSNQTQVFSVFSNQLTNENVIAQNNSEKGITVSATNLESSVNFFNESRISTGVADASIKYQLGGNIKIEVSDNLFLKTKVSASNRKEGLHTIKNETVVIYDISSGPFLYSLYEDLSYNTGSALTLVADNSNSNTALNIITPDGYGLALLGGGSRKGISKGVIGVYDNSGQLIISQSIISGNSKVICRSTIGINTIQPKNNDYVMCINGPVLVSHNEIIEVLSTTFEIKKMMFMDSDPLIGFAFGATISTIIEGKSTVVNDIKYTIDGGETWNSSIYSDGDDRSTLNDACITEGGTIGTYGVICGDSGAMIGSTDFITWIKI